MNIYEQIRADIDQYPAEWIDFLMGGELWEQSGLFEDVYTTLKLNDLVPYEVATRGDPYELVESYLTAVKHYEHE